MQAGSRLPMPGQEQPATDFLIIRELSWCGTDGMSTRVRTCPHMSACRADCQRHGGYRGWPFPSPVSHAVPALPIILFSLRGHSFNEQPRYWPNTEITKLWWSINAEMKILEHEKQAVFDCFLQISSIYCWRTGNVQAALWRIVT